MNILSIIIAACTVCTCLPEPSAAGGFVVSPCRVSALFDGRIEPAGNARQLSVRNGWVVFAASISWAPHQANHLVSLELPLFEHVGDDTGPSHVLTNVRLGRVWCSFQDGVYRPDVIVPLKLGTTFDLPWRRNNIPSQQSQTIVIEVFVPPDARTGVYKGRLELFHKGRSVAGLAMSLEVASVTLPDKADTPMQTPPSSAKNLWHECVVNALAGKMERIPAQPPNRDGRPMGIDNSVRSIDHIAFRAGIQDANLIDMLASRPGWNLMRIARMTRLLVSEGDAQGLRLFLIRELSGANE